MFVVRALLVLAVCVIAMTQGLGVLVFHNHFDAVGDGARHRHAYASDDDGHVGHAADLDPAEAAHGGEQTAARTAGFVVVLALAVMVLGERTPSGLHGLPVLVARTQRRRARRHPARLAMLAILRV